MRYLLTLVLMLLTSPALAFDHDPWDALLKVHVHWIEEGVASQVDYDGFTTDKSRLDAYLGSLSAVSDSQFQAFSRDQKLAFLINAYNAFTVKLILDQAALPASIRDIGSLFSGPWSQRFFSLLGKRRTLDELEHQMIRGNPRLMDPRIHFAVNCASVGCPALRPEAYTADHLQAQLEDNTRRFLSDRSRNRYEPESQRLYVSSIFKWYRKDFDGGNLGTYLAHYGEALAIMDNTLETLRQGTLDIRFLPYDWSLNSSAPKTP